jgi:hypothetical protein
MRLRALRKSRRMRSLLPEPLEGVIAGAQAEMSKGKGAPGVLGNTVNPCAFDSQRAYAQWYVPSEHQPAASEEPSASPGSGPDGYPEESWRPLIPSAPCW